MSEAYQSFEFVEIEPGFYSIEQDFVRSFLFIDHEKILLVDLGMGGNHLLEQIRSRWSLPITVVFTHADMDHVGDAVDFDLRYMHPSEIDYYNSKSTNAVPMLPIWEGEKIDIGSFTFEVVLMPGHTPGSIALLDRKKRILIGGDTIQYGPIFMFGSGRNFQSFAASMDKIQGLIEHIDWIYACHHDLKVPSGIVKQLIIGANEMMAGNVVGIPEPRFEGKVKKYTVDKVSFFSN